MIPNEQLQVIETVGNTKTIANFRITAETAPRLLLDLSDKLYRDKVLAVIREYSTNAADAMVQAGKPISDIVVTLPTYNETNFKIRDFGSGLTQEEISDIYCVLGESTKRNSNEYNGMFGYGCKAGFAHADSFTVTSWCNGIKSIYQCIKGDTKNPHQAILLNSNESDEPSGIEINIPVKTDSFYDFHLKSSIFYRYWPVLPKIENLMDHYKNNLYGFRNLKPVLSGDKWAIYPPSDVIRGVAYMGYIAYPIDWKILYEKMPLTQKDRALFQILESNNLILNFEMGELSFVNSREELEYTEETSTKLANNIQEIFGKIIDSIQNRISNASNLWEAKKIYNSIFLIGELEIEKGEYVSGDHNPIKILNGNLTRMEEMFRGKVFWNKIPISSPRFPNINRFDNTKSEIQDESHLPIEPILTVFRKKNSRVKVIRHFDSILAHNAVAVVINDINKTTGLQQIARYLIFKNQSIIKSVCILNFKTDELKNKFYEEYQFESVPVLKVSELVEPAKLWYQSVKPKYQSSGSGDGNNKSRSRRCFYYDTDEEKIKENDIPLMEIENGGYYLPLIDAIKRDKYGNFLGYYKTHSNHCNIDSLEYVSWLINHYNLDIEKIYLITPKTHETKYFQEELKEGKWINVFDYIKDNMDNIDYQELTNVHELCMIFSRECNYYPEFVKYIKNQNSIFHIIEKSINFNNFKQNQLLRTRLRTLGFYEKNDVTPNINYSKLKSEINKKYPLYETLVNNINIYDIKNICGYINAIDYCNQNNFNVLDK